MGFTILTAAALGFLGLGPPPPTPGMGRTIAGIARVPAGRVVVRDGAGPRHLPHRHGLQPARRRPARRPGPAAATDPHGARWLSCSPSAGCRVDFVTDRGVAQVLDGVNLERRTGRGRGPRRRERLRQDDAGARDPRHPARRAPRASAAARCAIKGQDLLRADPGCRERPRARPRDHVHSTRSVHVVQPGVPVETQIMDLDEVEVAAAAERRRRAVAVPPLSARAPPRRPRGGARHAPRGADPRAGAGAAPPAPRVLRRPAAAAR